MTDYRPTVPSSGRCTTSEDCAVLNSHTDDDNNERRSADVISVGLSIDILIKL